MSDLKKETLFVALSFHNLGGEGYFRKDWRVGCCAYNRL